MIDQSAIVYIVEDDDEARNSLALLILSSGWAARTYESASALLADLDQVHDGVIVTDLRMPVMDGLALIEALRAVGKCIPVVMTTGHADVPLAVRAMKLGVVDLVEKPYEPQTMIAAIRGATGNVRVSSGPEPAKTGTSLGRLTMRERQVLDGILAGLPNKLIARRLSISPRTVEAYRANIMAKANVSTLPDLIRLALSAASP